MSVARIEQEQKGFEIENNETVFRPHIHIWVNSEKFSVLFFADAVYHGHISDAASLTAASSHLLESDPLQMRDKVFQALSTFAKTTPLDLCALGGDAAMPIGVSVPISELDRKNLESLSRYLSIFNCPIAFIPGNHETANVRFADIPHLNNYELGQMKLQELVSWANSPGQKNSTSSWLFPHAYYSIDIHFQSEQIIRLVAISSSLLPQDPDQLLWLKAIIDEADRDAHIKNCVILSHHAIGDTPGKRIYAKEGKKYDLPEGVLPAIAEEARRDGNKEKAYRLLRLTALFQRRSFPPEFPPNISHHKMLEYMIRDILGIDLNGKSKVKMICIGHEHMSYLASSLSKEGLTGCITMCPGTAGDKATLKLKRLPPGVEHAEIGEEAYGFSHLTLSPNNQKVDFYSVSPSGTLSPPRSYSFQQGVLSSSPLADNVFSTLPDPYRAIFDTLLTILETGNLWLINWFLASTIDFSKEPSTIPRKTLDFFSKNSLSREASLSNSRFREPCLYYQYSAADLLRHLQVIYQTVINILEEYTCSTTNPRKEGFSIALAALEITLRFTVRSLRDFLNAPRSPEENRSFECLMKALRNTRKQLSISPKSIVFSLPTSSPSSSREVVSNMDALATSQRETLRRISYEMALFYLNIFLEEDERLCHISRDQYQENKKHLFAYRTIFFALLAIGNQDPRLALRALFNSDFSELQTPMATALAQQIEAILPNPPNKVQLKLYKHEYLSKRGLFISDSSAREDIVQKYFSGTPSDPNPLSFFLDKKNIETILRFPFLREQLFELLSENYVPYQLQIDSLFEEMGKLVLEEKSSNKPVFQEILNHLISTLFLFRNISRRPVNPFSAVSSLQDRFTALETERRSTAAFSLLSAIPDHPFVKRLNELENFLAQLAGSSDRDTFFHSIRQELAKNNPIVQKWLTNEKNLPQMDLLAQWTGLIGADKPTQSSSRSTRCCLL